MDVATTEQQTMSATTSDIKLEPQPNIEPSLQPIFQMIHDNPISLDNLVEATQLDTSVLLSGLLQLELAGVIAQLPGGKYQRS